MKSEGIISCLSLAGIGEGCAGDGNMGRGKRDREGGAILCKKVVKGKEKICHQFITHKKCTKLLCSAFQCLHISHCTNGYSTYFTSIFTLQLHTPQH